MTVPHYRDDDEYFEPIKDLRSDGVGRLYFGIVPYWPEKQAPGTTGRQVECIDRYVADWGVCTECGMARHDREGVPRLLDLHRSIVEGHPASV